MIKYVFDTNCVISSADDPTKSQGTSGLSKFGTSNFTFLYDLESSYDIGEDEDSFVITYSSPAYPGETPFSGSVSLKGKHAVGSFDLTVPNLSMPLIFVISAVNDNFYPITANRLAMAYDDGAKLMKNFNSINDAIRANISELEAADSELDPVPYSGEMATSLKQLIDIYKTALTAEESEELEAVPNHYNSLSDIVYALLQVSGKLYEKAKE